VEVLAVSGLLCAGPTFAADILNGQVLGGGAPIANATVTLWTASALRIAAGNVPNFVDLVTSDYGPTLLDVLKSAQTPTMANFATLANLARIQHVNHEPPTAWNPL
jgi:hypothetical protein